jgi:predicted nucleic acid-binding protein
VNRAGVLLDTGPIVALLSAADANHDRAMRVFAETAAPFRSCEAVMAEACLLMRKVHADGPAEVLALGRKGVIEIGMSLVSEWAAVEALLGKYADRPASLADACLIRCAELHQEPRLFSFETDFRIYRWARNRKFELV